MLPRVATVGLLGARGAAPRFALLESEVVDGGLAAATRRGKARALRAEPELAVAAVEGAHLGVLIVAADLFAAMSANFLSLRSRSCRILHVDEPQFVVVLRDCWELPHLRRPLAAARRVAEHETLHVQHVDGCDGVLALGRVVHAAKHCIGLGWLLRKGNQAAELDRGVAVFRVRLERDDRQRMADERRHIVLLAELELRPHHLHHILNAILRRPSDLGEVVAADFILLSSMVKNICQNSVHARIGEDGEVIEGCRRPRPAVDDGGPVLPFHGDGRAPCLLLEARCRSRRGRRRLDH